MDEDEEFELGSDQFKSGQHIVVTTLDDDADALGYLMSATPYGITYQATHKAVQIIPELTDEQMDDIERQVQEKPLWVLQAWGVTKLGLGPLAALGTPRRRLEDLLSLWHFEKLQMEREPETHFAELASTVLTYKPMEWVKRIESTNDWAKVAELEQAAEEERELLKKEEVIMKRLEEEVEIPEDLKAQMEAAEFDKEDADEV